MKTVNEAKTIDGVVDPKHEIEIVCSACGYDLDESELAADTCSNCEATLSLRQNTTIYATSIPAAAGDVSLQSLEIQMATYVNNLRLKEIATGDESGTWGTSTNTNLELIGESLGYATQAAFSSDADATTTVADGASDPARALYFKVTSGASLTATRTLTIGPNTNTRVMWIENATTGSQSINISQGSGANVTIATGKTKVVYLDGAGAGAAVVDALALVEDITDGDVVGPGSATNNNFTAFDGTTGKLVKDSAKAVPTGDVVGTSDTQTLTSKTLTSPKVGTGINDTNNAELLKVTATTSAVNELTLANSATGNNPALSATGDDTNVGINVTPKGTGEFNVTASFLTGIFSDKVSALGNTGTAKTLDASTAQVFTATLNGNVTFTLSGENAVSNRSSSFILILTNDGTASRTVAFTGGTVELPGGSVSRSTGANATDIWFFMTPDNGTTWYVNIPLKNMS